MIVAVWFPTFKYLTNFWTCQKSWGKSGWAKRVLASKWSSSSEEFSQEDESSITRLTLVFSIYSWALFTFCAANLNFCSNLGLLPFSPFNLVNFFAFRRGVCGLTPGLDFGLGVALPLLETILRDAAGGASDELSLELVLVSNRTAGYKEKINST